MKIVREEYSETIKNILSYVKYSHSDVENIEFLANYEDKDRMNDLFSYIESNYDKFHKGDINNKSYYMLRAASMIKNYGPLLENISNNCLSLLVTEFPFDLQTERNIDRFKALANDELLSGVRVLSNRYKPIDTICSFLQHYDENKHKIKDDSDLQRFRYRELDYLLNSKKEYYLTHYSPEDYIKKVKAEEVSKNGFGGL